jgi:hypothetical protein
VVVVGFEMFMVFGLITKLQLLLFNWSKLRVLKTEVVRADFVSRKA